MNNNIHLLGFAYCRLKRDALPGVKTTEQDSKGVDDRKLRVELTPL
jgi:hypothetical protein